MQGRLIFGSGAGRDRDHVLGDVAVLNAAHRLQSGRSDFQIIVLALELRLLLLQAVDLIAVGIRLRHLRQIEQTEQTSQHNQRDGIADGAQRASLSPRLIADRILVAARETRAVHGQ